MNNISRDKRALFPHRAGEAGDVTAPGTTALAAGSVAADEVHGVLDTRQPVAAGGGVVGGAWRKERRRDGPKRDTGKQRGGSGDRHGTPGEQGRAGLL